MITPRRFLLSTTLLTLSTVAACGNGHDGTSTSSSGAGGSGGSGSGSGGGTGGSLLVETPPPAYAPCPLDAFPAAQQVSFAQGGPPLSKDTTWTKDKLYLVDGPLQVDAPLTIQAGTTVCFSGGTDLQTSGALQIAEGTSLSIQGTADEPVTLTSRDPDAHWWNIFAHGPSKLEIHHARIHHAGLSQGNGQGAIDLTEPGEPAILDDVIFVGLGTTPALSISGDAALAPGADVWIASVDAATTPAVEVDPFTAGSLSSKIRFSASLPEAALAISIPEGVDLTRTVTWPNVGVPYLVSLLIVGGDQDGSDRPTLTLSPGTIVWLQGTLYIGYQDRSGDLVAAGTASEPVTLTGAFGPGGGGDWSSIVFSRNLSGQGYDPNVSRLSHAALLHGGDDDMPEILNCHDPASGPGAGMVEIDDDDGAYPGPAIDHTSFAHSSSDAIRATARAGTYLTTDYTAPALGNTFTDIAGKPAWPATPCP